jgi:tagatose-6-phosphate ketose/aldose isomerase
MTWIRGENESVRDRNRSASSDPAFGGSVDGWLESLRGSGAIGELLSVPGDERVARGYGHTLREICQQPLTWPETASVVLRRADDVRGMMDGAGALVLTGSGSSSYAGECAAPCLQETLGRPATALPTGRILTHPGLCLPPSGPYLVVSLARSGDSPESRAAVDWLLEAQPRARHLTITCNRRGALATSYADVPNVLSVVLDDKTNDESLVMTSSFSNLVVAARTLGALDSPETHESRTRTLARAAARVLRESGDALGVVGGEEKCRTAVFLGSGCRLGAAREAALKMLEMTAGEVWTLSESFLGLRHGPMSALRKDTLLVAFLSSDPLVRPYEVDLLRELDQKQLGRRRVLVGAQIPRELAGEGVVIVDCDPISSLDDADLTVIDTLVGQLLAFFRCRAGGYRPDSPSASGVITRVVSSFAIHRRSGVR